MKKFLTHPAVHVATLLLFAGGLRFANIGLEEAWYDEFLSLKHIELPTLEGFLWKMSRSSPAVPPLYFTLEYYWYHAVWGSEFGLRVLSILLSLGGLALVYGIALRLFDHATALATLAVLALNGEHIFHSQNIRMYILVFLFAAAAIYFLLCAVERGRAGDWFANAIANALLVWTHPIAALALVPQGVLVLLRWGVDWKAWAWGCVQVASVVSVAVYLYTQHDLERTTAQMMWLKAPAVLASGGTPNVETLLLHWAGYRFVPPEAELWLLNTNTRMGELAVLAFGACFVLLGLAMGRGRVEEESVVRRHRVVLLSAWVVLPVAILFVLAHVWTPVFHYRYLLFCLPGCALLMASGAMGLPRPWLRVVAVVLLLGVLAFLWVNAFGVALRPLYGRMA